MIKMSKDNLSTVASNRHLKFGPWTYIKSNGKTTTTPPPLPSPPQPPSPYAVTDNICAHVLLILLPLLLLLLLLLKMYACTSPAREPASQPANQSTSHVLRLFATIIRSTSTKTPSPGDQAQEVSSKGLKFYCGHETDSSKIGWTSASFCRSLSKSF
uniref:Uncharacterized protein n=1 Tax=Glossina palpalis gambiensis TaxID=67801 RepID=A0A1B0AQ63_9MUSC